MQTKGYTLLGRIAFQAYMTKALYERFEDKDITDVDIADLIAIGQFGLATTFLWQPHLFSPTNLVGRGLVKAWPLYAGWGLGVAVGAPISYAIAGEEGVEDFLDVATGQVGWDEYDEAIQEGFGGWGGIPGALWDITGAPIVDYLDEQIVEPVGDWFSDAMSEISQGVATVQAEIGKAKASVIQASTPTVMYLQRKVRRGINVWENIAYKPWYIA